MDVDVQVQVLRPGVAHQGERAGGAQQIKTVLEQQFSGCIGQTANRIMQISNGLRDS